MTMPEIELLRTFNAINFEKEFVTSSLEVKPRGFLMIHFPRAVKWIRDTKVFEWLQETTFIGRIFPKIDANPLTAAQQVERNINVILADDKRANDPEVQAVIQKSIQISVNLLGHYASTTSPATNANGWMDIANNLQNFIPKEPAVPTKLETKHETPTTKSDPVPSEPEVPKTPEKTADATQPVVTTPVTPPVTRTVATPDAPKKKKDKPVKEAKPIRSRKQQSPYRIPQKTQAVKTQPATQKKQAKKP